MAHRRTSTRTSTKAIDMPAEMQIRRIVEPTMANDGLLLTRSVAQAGVSCFGTLHARR